MKVSVIIVAAGSGRRFGYERNKLFFPLCGKPVLTHTLQHVFAAACVSEVVIVVAERDRRDIEDMVAGLHPSVPVRFALGGAEREDSVYNGLVAADESADIIMVHDGSRPMAGPEWFDNAVPVMEKANVAVYAIPVKDTVKEREEAGAWGLQRGPEPPDCCTNASDLPAPDTAGSPPVRQRASPDGDRRCLTGRGNGGKGCYSPGG